MKKQPDGGPVLFGLTLIVMVVAIGLGHLLGLGKASVLAALVGLFCVLGSLSGSLRPDLRRMAILAPALLIAACVPRALSAWNSFAGILAVALAIFVIALAPAVSERLRVTTIGITYAVIAGYGVALPEGTPETHVVGAVALGIAIALLARVLIGMSDPSLHTRQQLAAPLLDGEVDTVDIVRSWLLDAPTVWTTDALDGGLRYRRTVQLLHRCTEDPNLTGAQLQSVLDALETLKASAAETASLIIARGTVDPKVSTSSAGTIELTQLPTDWRPLVEEAQTQLDRVHRAAVTRDCTPAADVATLRSTYLRARLRSVLIPGSAVLPQAAAKTCGVLAAWATGLQMSQPALTNTYFNAVISMLQPSWSETIARVVYRLVGSILAVVIVVAAAIWLPAPVMLAIAVLGLFCLTWFLFSHPIVSNAGGTAMTVALTATTQHLQPLSTLGQLAIMLAVAAVIVLLVSLPTLLTARSRSLRTVKESARTGSRDLIEELGTDDISRPANQFAVFLHGTQLATQIRTSAALLPDADRITGGRLADAIEALTLLGTVYADRHTSASERGTLLQASRELLTTDTPTAEPDVESSPIVLCAAEIAGLCRPK